MSEHVASESQLADPALFTRASAVDSADIVIAERPLLGHVNLRGDPHDGRFIAAVERATGIALPLAPNTVAEGHDTTICWLGPDEWLLVMPRNRVAEIASALCTALDGAFAAVTEISGGQTVIVLRGRAARDVLARGCPLDLHPRTFAPGRCAQSRLAKAPILLRQVDMEPAFEIVVRRSFADYLWSWLTEAAADAADVTSRAGDRERGTGDIGRG